jgi:hypothetical protein
VKSLRFVGVFLVMSLAAVLVHEFGHCLFYWIQGIPAGMSLVKEYPLRNITDLEYAIGSAGGPLMNVLLLVAALLWLRRTRPDTGSRRWAMALIIANLSYFIIRSVLALLKNDGGELTDAASLVGLSFHAALVFFLAVTVFALVWMVKVASIPVRVGSAFRLLGLVFLNLFFLVALEAFDQAFFWEKFPTIEIGQDRLYNEHRR